MHLQVEYRSIGSAAVFEVQAGCPLKGCADLFTLQAGFSLFLRIQHKDALLFRQMSPFAGRAAA